MADEKINTRNTSMSIADFDEVTLRLAHVEALLELTMDHYQSAQGPLVSALMLMREQVRKAQGTLTDGAHRA